MMLSPAATPAAGTETVVVVPVEFTVAVPMFWTNAISACASHAARLNRNASASVATAGRAGFLGEAPREVRGVSPAIARAASAISPGNLGRRIEFIGFLPSFRSSQELRLWYPGWDPARARRPPSRRAAL